LRQGIKRLGKRAAHVIAESEFGKQVAALHAIQPLVVVHASVVSGLEHKLCHDEVERGIGKDQSQYIERGCQFEAPRHVNHALEDLFHNSIQGIRGQNTVALMLQNYGDGCGRQNF